MNTLNRKYPLRGGHLLARHRQPAAMSFVSYSSCRECGCQSVGSSQRASGRLSYLNPSSLSSNSSSSLSSPRCPFCVASLLQPHLERYQQALQERDAARDKCGRELERLRQGQTTLSELQFESQRLLDRLASLQKECSSLAVQVTAQAVENEHRQAQQEQSSNTSVTRQQLERLRQSVCEGALQGAIGSATEQVRRLRFQWAMQAFIMHRLDVDYDHDLNNNSSSSSNNCSNSSNSSSSKNSSSTTPTSQQKQQHPAFLRRRQAARGIGKIGGLPLPHAGPELYGVLPPRELQSALRLVASLTCTVARCLAIVLPHPILLQPNMISGTSGVMGDIIEPVAKQQSPIMESLTTNKTQASTTTTNTSNVKADPVVVSSASSLLSLMEKTTSTLWGRSTKTVQPPRATTPQHTLEGQAVSRNTPSLSVALATSSSSPSCTDSPLLISRRILHATCAVLAEDFKAAATSSRYALSESVMHQEEFAIALQLLQNNVIALCIRAGVPVNCLFPAEALLLNLHALAMYCQEQIATLW